MEATNFKVGDVVKLKSGSINMTVSVLDSLEDGIKVIYFDVLTNIFIETKTINTQCFELVKI